MMVHLCTARPSDRRFCFVDDHVSAAATELTRGQAALPVLEEFEEDGLMLELDERAGGLERPDLLGCNLNYLVFHRPCAEAILANFQVGPHELIPVKLINKKKRVHADDYVLLNPLGGVDCLDRERSEMDDDPDDPAVVIFGTWSLRSAALPNDRDIFRVQGLLLGYLFSDRLVEFIRERGFTNFVFESVQVT